MIILSIAQLTKTGTPDECRRVMLTLVHGRKRKLPWALRAEPRNLRGGLADTTVAFASPADAIACVRTEVRRASKVVMNRSYAMFMTEFMYPAGALDRPSAQPGHLSE